MARPARDGEFYRTVANLWKAGKHYSEIAILTHVSRGAVAGLITRLRRAGVIAPAPQLPERQSQMPRAPRAKLPPRQPAGPRPEPPMPLPVEPPTMEMVCIVELGERQCKAVVGRIGYNRHELGACCGRPRFRASPYCVAHTLRFLPLYAAANGLRYMVAAE